MNTVLEHHVPLIDAEVIYQLSACQLPKNDSLCMELVKLN